MNNDIIHAYSRTQALADGVLVDVSDMAKQAGFIYPVALTRLVWEECVAWDNASEQVYQDEPGRLWDLLTIMHRTALECPLPVMHFSILRIPRGGHQPEKVDLWTLCGPGDDERAVVTVMFPDED
ncbi:MAG TPA: hypothetical protein PLV42_05485 [bacterium]|nr:hypothetical protein [bacterium]